MVPASGTAVPGRVAALRRYVSASRAASMRDKCERAWDAFQLWCDAEGLTALPVHLDTVAAHLMRCTETGPFPSALA